MPPNDPMEASTVPLGLPTDTLEAPTDQSKAGQNKIFSGVAFMQR